MTYTTWRDEPHMICTNFYKKKFAFLPITTICDEKIWWKHYYVHIRIWETDISASRERAHPEVIGNISEAEFIVRKLTEVH